MPGPLFINHDNWAVRSWIQQLVATDRDEPTAQDRAALYATSVIAHRAGNKRADAVAGVPLVIKDKTGEPISKTDAMARVLARNYRDNMRRSELTLCFWTGNLLQKRRAYSDLPYSLHWINPILWRRDLGWRGLRGFTIAQSSRAQWVGKHYINREDAVYMHGMDFDNDFAQVAPIEVAFRYAELGVEMAETQVAFQRNRAIPAAIVQPASDAKNIPSDRDRDRLQSLLQRAFQGARNAGRVLIQASRFEWIQLQSRFDEAGFAEQFEQSFEAVSIAFDIPIALIRESASSYAQAEVARRDWGHSWVVPRMGWYAEQYTEQLLGDAVVARRYGKDLIVEPDFDDVPMLKEDQAAKINNVNAQVTGGYKDLYTAAVETGEKNVPEVLRGKYMWGGVPTPIEAIDTLWQSRQGIPAFAPGALPTEDAALPARPVDPAAGADAIAQQNVDLPPVQGKSICVMIGLGPNPELIDLQRRIKAIYPEMAIKWNAPDDFHVTLLYAPAATPMQIASLQTALEQTVWADDMTLRIGSLRSFDNLGEYALHFRVGENSDLRELQGGIYLTAQECGIVASTFSDPAQYIPHITMGYANTKPRTVIFNSKIRVKPLDLQIAVDEEVVYRRAWVEAAAAPSRSWLPDSVYKELKDWRLVVERKGRGYDFITRALNEYPARHFLLDALNGDYDVDAIFDLAAKGMADNLPPNVLWRRVEDHEQSQVISAWTLCHTTAKRAYSDTRAAFVAELLRLIGDAQKDDISRSKFGGQMRSVLRRYGLQAFRDGMNSVGYDPESLNKEELGVFRAWQERQSKYVAHFGAEIFKQGITENEVSIRANMWADISLEEIRLIGVAMGDGDSLHEWGLGQGEIDHCEDCPKLDGFVLPIRTWLEKGLTPGSGKTKCKQGCLCTLRPTDKPLTERALPSLSARSTNLLELHLVPG